jgi:hypothetical protein
MGQFVGIAGPCSGAVRHDAFSMTTGDLMSRATNFKLTHYRSFEPPVATVRT